MLKYLIRRRRQGGFDDHVMVGPVPRQGDRVRIDGSLFLVIEVVWTPEGAGGTEAEVTVN